MTLYLNFRAQPVAGGVISPYMMIGDGADPPGLRMMSTTEVQNLLFGKNILFVAHGFNVDQADAVSAFAAAEGGRALDDGIIICPAPTHNEIAASIGWQREAVAREFKRLEADHIVEVRRCEVRIAVRLRAQQLPAAERPRPLGMTRRGLRASRAFLGERCCGRAVSGAAA